MQADHYITFGILLALGGLLWTRLFGYRNRVELRARFCEIAALAARRRQPLGGLVRAAADEFGSRRLMRMHAALEEGVPFATAGRKLFGREGARALTAAEGTAAFPDALSAAAADSERSLDLRHRALLALAYPALLLLFLGVFLGINTSLREIIDSLDHMHRAALWLQAAEHAARATLYALGAAALVLLVFGRYPGRALFAMERRLRRGDMDVALPADLAARLRATHDAASIADACARRAERRAKGALRILQLLALLAIALVAALQFGTVFAIQQGALAGVVPW
ncbi:MAG: type II secretion system F family protein [Planctomycetota bacterium]|jgi:hypothetical protein